MSKTTYRKDYTPPPWLIEKADLHFTLDAKSTLVKARLEMRRNPAATEKGDALVLNAENMAVEKVTVNGLAVRQEDLTHKNDLLTIRHMPTGNPVVLETQVRINPSANSKLEGLYEDTGGMLCTQCEAEGFRRITPWPDRPDVLTSFTVTLEAEKARYPVLLSNGNLVKAGDLPEGRHFTTMGGRDVTLRIYTEPHNINKCDYAMEALKNSMKWDEEAYGREYDLDVFNIVAVDAFNMGAMENKSLNIFNAKYVLVTPETATDSTFEYTEAVIGHEYFHNWSGNRVTCRHWSELSLKEGFTVFRDEHFSSDMNDAAVVRISRVNALRSHQFPEDAGPMAHAVRPESYQSINNFYSATVYQKGAEVVRMLHTLLGEELFRKGCDLYFERHDGQAVTCDDFVRAMEEASGRDLSQFMLWYSQAGTPVLNVKGRYLKKRKEFKLTVHQTCPPTPGQKRKKPFHIPLKMALLGKDGRELPLQMEGRSAYDPVSGVLNITQRRETFTFTGVEEPPTPSLLRGFSAPVKLNYPYTRQELLFLMANDPDGFNRWEAGQTLALEALRNLVANLATGSKDAVIHTELRAAFQQVLEGALSGKISPALAAEALTLPSETFIAEMTEGELNLDAIELARKTVRCNMAASLAGLFERGWRQFRVMEPYTPTADQIGRRTLANLCLGYLAELNKPEMVVRYQELLNAGNMTDSLTGLRLLLESRDSEAAEAALTAFHKKWEHDPIVMESWFAIQSSLRKAGGLGRVAALLKHPAFNIKRPNTVRALLGGFTRSGVKNFHNPDGSGYRFITDQVLKLDGINTEAAAGLVSCFNQWKRYDEPRRNLIQSELKRILAEGGETLSKSVREIVEKALA